MSPRGALWRSSSSSSSRRAPMAARRAALASLLASLRRLAREPSRRLAREPSAWLLACAEPAALRWLSALLDVLRTESEVAGRCERCERCDAGERCACGRGDGDGCASERCDAGDRCFSGRATSGSSRPCHMRP